MVQTSRSNQYKGMEQLAFFFIPGGVPLEVDKGEERPRVPRSRPVMLPKGACRLKMRPCVNCGELMKARYPSRCRKCKRHVEVEDLDDYEVHL